MQKLYCYVDESGQDTQGKFFIVALVAVSNTATRDKVEKKLSKLELQLGKKTDWRHTRVEVKIAYLKKVMQLEELRGGIFYALFRGIKNYDFALSQAIIKAIEVLQTTMVKPPKVTISIEGELSETKKKKVSRALRKAKIRYRTLRGERFSSNSLVRLADACAGFISDWERGKSYMEELLSHPRFSAFFRKLS